MGEGERQGDGVGGGRKRLVKGKQGSDMMGPFHQLLRQLLRTIASAEPCANYCVNYCVNHCVNYCELLQTIAKYCELLRNYCVNHCERLPTKANAFVDFRKRLRTVASTIANYCVNCCELLRQLIRTEFGYNLRKSSGLHYPTEKRQTIAN